MIQFNNLLKQLSKDLRYQEMRLAWAQGNKYDPDLFPLYPSVDRLRKTKKLNSLNQMSIDDFVNKLNSIGR